MLTAQQMRELEAASGISGVQLMENAGKAFAAELLKNYDVRDKKVLVACYHGKNGGDGLVIADLLARQSEVDLLFLGDEEKMVKETEHFFHHVNNNALIQFVTPETVDFDEYDFIIDAILGIGLHHYLKPEISSAIKLINESKALKVAVDIPTGVNPDTGNIVSVAVNPNLIITFHDLKPGLSQFGEKVRVVPIGL